MSEISVTYKQSGDYKIFIEKDYSKLSEAVNGYENLGSKVLIITDSNVKELYYETVKSIISDTFETVDIFTVPASEDSKSLKYVSMVYDFLLNNKYHRNDTIIALGGGVIGDLSGFVASTYLRGMNLIMLPTTLLSMSDSSIGGKCGVNLDSYKNMVGAFKMPLFIYSAVSSLKSLDNRQFSSGMAEVLKSALIKNASFYEWLIMNFNEINERDEDTLIEVIEQTDKIKTAVVVSDPFEKGDRKLLNFGHTLGHAIEKYYEFGRTHGECITLGMICASYIAYKRQLLSMEEFYEIRDMFVPFDLPISTDSFDIDRIIELTASDKKASGNTIDFILLKKIGKAVIVKDVTKEEMKDSLQSLIVEWD